MASLRTLLIDTIREEVRPAPLRLLEAFLDTVPPAAQTPSAAALTATKAAVLARLAQKEAAAELAPEALRQRILELNRAASAAAKQTGAAQAAFRLNAEGSMLRLSLDPTRSRDLAEADTRQQLAQSLIEDTPPSDSAILQAPRATDASAQRVVQVFISHAWETLDVERILDKFLERLRFEVSNLPPDRPYRIKLWFDRWDLSATAPTFAAETVKHARASQIALFVLSNKWYTSQGCKAEANAFRTSDNSYDLTRIIRLQLSGRREDGNKELVSGPVLPEFFCDKKPHHMPSGVANLIEFYGRANPSELIELAEYTCRQITDMIDKLPPEPSPQPPPNQHPPLDTTGQKLALYAGKIDEHDLVVRERKALPPRASRNEESAEAPELLPVLEHWVKGGTAEAPAKNRVCVLLGSFGSGKTIATQMFARRLHDLREADKTVPFPVYLDFRRLIPRVQRDGDIPALQDVIASSLSDKVGPIDGQMVLSIVRGEPCVILFDGLDEVGTALGVEKTARLYRQLMEIVPREAWNRDAERKAAQWAACPIRIMVTCRSHFFRNVIQQRTTFAEYSRQSAQPDLAASELVQTYFMAPFTPEQVERFFIASLGEDKGRELFAVIGRITDLQDLATKPVMTRFVAELSDELMADHAAGRVINAATLYEHLFNKALARDGEKDVALEVRYQQNLLQELAIHLWQSNATSMRVTALETWFGGYVLGNPELAHLSLNPATPLKQLQTELRNASLLIRQNDDEFRFVHTSFFEYFLGLALKNRLIAGALPMLPQSSAVNAETRHFLLDSAARDTDTAALGLALATLLRPQTDVATRQFAWDMLALGRGRGLAWPVPSHANCAGLDLRDQTIAPPQGAAEIAFDGVDFAGANFCGAAIRDAAFHHCALEATILSNALIARCRFTACTGSPFGASSARLKDCQIDALTRKAALRGVLFAFPPLHPGMPASSVLRVQLSLGELNSAVFSPDGTCVLTASSDGTARLFDRASSREIARYQGHERGVTSAVFSHDGTCVLTASDDGTARLFDRASSREIARYQGHERGVTSAVFSPDGTCVLTASHDGTTRLFDRASSREIARYQGHEGMVTSAVFSPDGTCVLTASDDRTVRLFDRASSREIARYQGHEDGVTSAVFSPDGTCVLTASHDGTARLFDRAFSREIARYQGHENWVRSAVFSRDGDCVLTASHDGTARLFDRASSREIARYLGHGDWVTSAVFSPDGISVLTASYDGTTRLFDRASSREIARYQGHGEWLTSAVFSPDGTCVLTASHDGTTRLFDRASSREIVRYQGHQFGVSSAVFSSDGTCVLTASFDRTARLFDRASSREIARYQGHEGGVTSAVFSPDGNCVLTASHHHIARLFDRASSREIARYQGHEGMVTSAVFSPDGTCVLTASHDHTARLFDRASSREIARYLGHRDEVTSAVFSPDGTCVLTASFDRTARLFDRALSREIARYQGHRDWLACAAFSPDGTCVLTASYDGIVRLFDRATARCLRQLVLFPDDYAVCDPDGTVLSTGPNGWKYIHALAPVPSGLPKVLCPDHVPIHVPVDLLGRSPTHMPKAKRRSAPRSPADRP